MDIENEISVVRPLTSKEIEQIEKVVINMGIPEEIMNNAKSATKSEEN